MIKNHIIYISVHTLKDIWSLSVGMRKQGLDQNLMVNH